MIRSILKRWHFKALFGYIPTSIDQTVAEFMRPTPKPKTEKKA